MLKLGLKFLMERRDEFSLDLVSAGNKPHRLLVGYSITEPLVNRKGSRHGGSGVVWRNVRVRDNSVCFSGYSVCLHSVCVCLDQ